MTEQIFKDWAKEKKQMPFDMAKNSTYSMKDMINFCKYASKKQLLLRVASQHEELLLEYEEYKHSDLYNLNDGYEDVIERFLTNNYS